MPHLEKNETEVLVIGGGKPIIGRTPLRRNLYVVTGLASSGFGWGPMAGKLLADYIHTGHMPQPLAEADPARCITKAA